MGRVAITDSILTDIADAIRYKASSTATLTPSNMAQAISNISGGAISLKDYIIRPDSELVLSSTYDKMAVTDEKLTLPSYTTSSSTVKTTSNITTYVTDPTNYNYSVVSRLLTIPVYNIDTIAKGRLEYTFGAHSYELMITPKNGLGALINDTTCASSYAAFSGTKSVVRLCYWSTASTVTSVNSAAYGLTFVNAAPTISGKTITLKAPYFIARGHTTYFTSTYMNAVTDVRLQYVIEIYRTPKNHLNINGW